MAAFFFNLLKAFSFLNCAIFPILFKQLLLHFLEKPIATLRHLLHIDRHL